MATLRLDKLGIRFFFAFGPVSQDFFIYDSESWLFGQQSLGLDAPWYIRTVFPFHYFLLFNLCLVGPFPNVFVLDKIFLFVDFYFFFLLSQIDHSWMGMGVGLSPEFRISCGVFFRGHQGLL